MDVKRIVDVVERPCPFLNRDDPRCGGRFSLRRLGLMFGYCLGQPSACPTYHRLQHEAPGRDTPQPAIALTVFGRRVEPAEPVADAA